MRKAAVYINRELAGHLTELDQKAGYTFEYLPDYSGFPASLTLPLSQKKFVFDDWPAFFDGLLPEGYQLEALLRQNKIDRKDYFSQLLAVGEDLVGAVRVESVP